jgi:catechol 2,3-dioxygenase-like lactoylglutathione lyase family enzyme
MSMWLATVTFLVRDYDEAIAWFTTRLGFTLLEDMPLTEEKRWVRVGHGYKGGLDLLLARAVTDEQRSQVGRQAGGRIAFFLETDDFFASWLAMQEAGVVFHEAPRQESYGTVAVFEDLYGNRWDLIQPARKDV